MRDARKMIEERGTTVDLESLEPWEDSSVWEMLATGNGRGVHHIESPAMISPTLVYKWTPHVIAQSRSAVIGVLSVLASVRTWGPCDAARAGRHRPRRRFR